MSDIESCLMDSRSRLTALLQDHRAGVPKGQVLFGMLRLGAELVGRVLMEAADGLRQMK